jgi:hypothetical protein
MRLLDHVRTEHFLNVAFYAFDISSGFFLPVDFER